MSSSNICGPLDVSACGPVCGQPDEPPLESKSQTNNKNITAKASRQTLASQTKESTGTTVVVETESAETVEINRILTRGSIYNKEFPKIRSDGYKTVKKLYWIAIQNARSKLARKYFYSALRMPNERILPPGMTFPVQPTQSCTPGLQNLIYEFQLYFQQCMEEHWTPEFSDGWKWKKRYHILNSEKRRLFYAAEDWVSNTQWHLSGARPFILKVLDYNCETLFTIQRRWTLCLFLWAGMCFGSDIRVVSGTGHLIGTVSQRFKLFHGTAYDILDVEGQVQVQVRGPLRLSKSHQSDIQILQVGKDGKCTKIGRIRECPYGLGISNLPAAANLTFPLDLNPELKSLLLATLVVLYFTRYDREERASNLSHYRQSVVIRMDPNDILMMNPSTGHLPAKWAGWKIFLAILFFFTVVILLLLKNNYQKNLTGSVMSRSKIYQSLRNRL